jgi:proteasome assembly chaperone (PAC2) family protein
MSDLVELWGKPSESEVYMIAGWHQWADAGSISSGLPLYLIEELDAEQIGEIHDDSFYLFQIPGTHHFLRPEVKFDEGRREALQKKKNEIFYASTNNKGLIIFLGDEPHMNADRYAEAFFSAVKSLGVKRVVAIGGVYGAMPYDKDRQVSCTYSLPQMKKELESYAVRFSNYEGGATIGSFFVSEAEPHDIEFLVFNAFVPHYDFAQDASSPRGVSIENDFKAWYDLMRRFNHMFDLRVDLSDLDSKSDALTQSMDEQIQKLAQELPQLPVSEYMEQIDSEFTEMSFMPLDDIWEQELGDLFDDLDSDRD